MSAICSVSQHHIPSPSNNESTVAVMAIAICFQNSILRDAAHNGSQITSPLPPRPELGAHCIWFLLFPLSALGFEAGPLSRSLLRQDGKVISARVIEYFYISDVWRSFRVVRDPITRGLQDRSSRNPFRD